MFLCVEDCNGNVSGYSFACKRQDRQRTGKEAGQVRQNKSNCVKCPYHGKGHDVCLSCTWNGEPSHGGFVFVSLDAAQTPEIITRGRMAPDFAPGGSRQGFTIAGVEDKAAEWLKALFVEISSLKPDEVEALVLLSRGNGFAYAAKLRKVSVADVRRIVRRVFVRCPKIRAVSALAHRAGWTWKRK